MMGGGNEGGRELFREGRRENKERNERGRECQQGRGRKGLSYQVKSCKFEKENPYYSV